MKRSYYIFILLTGWLCLSLSGCQSPLTGEPGDLFRAQPLTAALSVVPPSDPCATKSSYTGADDAVNNWNLLVFEGGILQAKYYRESAGDLSLDIMTDRPYRYYALANVGDLTGQFTVGTTTVDDMRTLRINAGIAGGLPMAWSSPDPIAFSRRQIVSGQKLSIPLTRLVGRYDIVIDPSGLSAWTFTATRLALCGVTSVTPFESRSRATAASVVTDAATAADLATLNAGGAASYYPLENCLGNLLPAGNSPWNKIPANIPSDAYPSYIEIGGTLRMTDGSELTRELTCRFCLGENAADNFDVVRNQTHTVTLLLSDASVSGDSHHWKLETGSYTDTRSLAFTHETILLPPGSSVDEAIVRTPAGLKYTVEADPALIQAGVTLSENAWGSVMDSDQLVFSAPAESAPLSGPVRLKTLDGSRFAEATLIVGRIPASLIVTPSSDQRLLTGGGVVTYTAKVTYTGVSGQFDVDPDDLVWSIDDEDIVEYIGDGKLRSKTKRGQTSVQITYTENGTTVSASRNITTYATLQRIRVDPEEIYLPGCGSENFADSRYTKNYSTSTNVQVHVYAIYHDGIEVDVSEASTWTGNMPMLFYVNSDNYSHAANAYASTHCNGQVSVYRAYTNSESADIYLGPPVDAYRYKFYNLTRLGNAPKTFITASYTEGKVTKTANVKATIKNPALPVSLSISPSAQEAFSGGFIATFTATCTLEDGTQEVVTSKAEWSADGLVTSNGNGRFTTGGTNGTTQVHASYTYNGVTVTTDASLTLRDRAITKVELCVLGEEGDWLWDRKEVETGSGQSWRIRVVYEDNDITFKYDGFDLTSSNPSVVAASGSSSHAVGLGSAVVTASFGGVTSNGVTIDVVQPSAGKQEQPEKPEPEEPSLSAYPAELSWQAEEAGSTAGRSFRITGNTEWIIEGVDEHWQVSPTRGNGYSQVTVYPVTTNSTSTDLETKLTISGKGVSSQIVRLIHYGQASVPPMTRYKVVTSVMQASIPVGGMTSASAVLYASTDGGTNYSVLRTDADSFSDETSGAHVSLSGSTVTGVSIGTARIRGHFEGYTADDWEDASLTVVPATEPEPGPEPEPETKYLTANPISLNWAWNAAGSGSSSDILVSANVDWSVKQCPDGFAYTQDASSVSIWPQAANESFSAPKMGFLVLGADGVSDVTVELRQDSRPRQLMSLRFDRSSYDLVSIVAGTLSYSQPFTLTADYDDGSQVNVTAMAGYVDQGCLSVDPVGGNLTATAACGQLTLTASYGGLTATSRYTAQALECPESLAIGRLESQDDPGLNFVLDDVTVTLSKAFSDELVHRKESTALQCFCSSNIVLDQYEEGSGWQFHFTESGSGFVRFTYTLNGKTIEGLMNLNCNSKGKITKQ